MLLFHPPYHFVELNMGQPFRGGGPIESLKDTTIMYGL